MGKNGNVIWKKAFLISKIRKMNITKQEKDTKINKLCNQLNKPNQLINLNHSKFKIHNSILSQSTHPTHNELLTTYSYTSNISLITYYVSQYLPLKTSNSSGGWTHLDLLFFDIRPLFSDICPL